MKEKQTHRRRHKQYLVTTIVDAEMKEQGFTGKGSENVNYNHKTVGPFGAICTAFSYYFHLVYPVSSTGMFEGNQTVFVIRIR